MPYPESVVAVEQTANTLAIRLAAGLFFSVDFTMLIWPVGSAAWKSLDCQLAEVPAGAILRFAVRAPLSLDHAQEVSPEILKFKDEEPELYQEIESRIQDNSIDGDIAINAILSDTYGIDYQRLIANNDCKSNIKSDVFFLCFVPASQELWEKDQLSRGKTRERTSAEHDYLVRFLQENGAREIYSMQSVGSPNVEKSGAWDHFRHNVRNGCIIVSPYSPRIHPASPLKIPSSMGISSAMTKWSDWPRCCATARSMSSHLT